MNKKGVFYFAKFLEGAGMVVVLVGLVISMKLGFQDEGLSSQKYSLQGLLWGIGLFTSGYVIERVIGSR